MRPVRPAAPLVGGSRYRLELEDELLLAELDDVLAPLLDDAPLLVVSSSSVSPVSEASPPSKAPPSSQPPSTTPASAAPDVELDAPELVEVEALDAPDVVDPLVPEEVEVDVDVAVPEVLVAVEVDVAVVVVVAAVVVKLGSVVVDKPASLMEPELSSSQPASSRSNARGAW